MGNVLILCTGNSACSQMMEAYFRCYARGMGLFFSAETEQVSLNKYAVQVMAEDNIDLTEQSSVSPVAYTKVPFEHVITIPDLREEGLLEGLDYQQLHYLPVPAPSQSVFSSEEEELEAFRQTRDELKQIVLRFIGKELLREENKLSV